MYTATDYLAKGVNFLKQQYLPSSKKKLSKLMFYATDICDSRCKHCLIWAKRPIVYMPTSKILEIMKSSCVTQNTNVGLEGGEFLLHPEAEEILEWFSLNHKNYDLLSNCLQPERLITLAGKYKPRRLFISLDGTEETYLYMRGKDGYKKVIKVIESLHQTVPVSVMFTLSPYNGFDDMFHVAEVCKKYSLDLRIGIYNNIAFFDTIDEAHTNEVSSLKIKEPLKVSELKNMVGIKNNTPPSSKATDTLQKPFDRKLIYEKISQFKENYDFIVLYEEWKKGDLVLPCYSIRDNLVILPNGDVPICQNLDVMLGNVNSTSLDEIINDVAVKKTQEYYVHNCNKCWINFHRKYDIVLFRNFEKMFGRNATKKLLGYYQWCETENTSYKNYISESK